MKALEIFLAGAKGAYEKGSLECRDLKVILFQDSFDLYT